MGKYRCCLLASLLAMTAGCADGLALKKVLRILPWPTKVHANVSEGWIDIVERALPNEWLNFSFVGCCHKLWHSGMAYPKPWSAPSFPDFNGDGVPDFFNHLHFHTHGDPALFWDVGLGSLTTDDVSGLASPVVAYRSAASKMITYVQHLEEEGIDESGFFKNKIKIDAHGVAILDIDRDGHLDMYIATGCKRGRGMGFDNHNVLMWGEHKPGGLGFALKGGRLAAQKAQLQNEDGRGRFSYWADMDGDGLLDVLIANDPRNDNMPRPSRFMMNNGRRSFSEDPSFGGYVRTAILTDADGDGLAQELVIGRPYHQEPGVPLSPVRSEIYKYDSSARSLKLVESSFVQCASGGFATGDFDEDLTADIAYICEDHVHLHYSSHRNGDTILGGKPSVSLSYPKEKCPPLTLRAVDIDLDGRLDLLLISQIIGCETIWSQNSNGTWVVREQSFLKKDASTMLRTGAIVRQEELGNSATSHNADVDEDVDEDRLGQLIRQSAETEADEDEHVHNLEPFMGRVRGVSVVDFNNDGFPDIALSSVGRRTYMYQSQWRLRVGHSNFLAIRLHGSTSNTHGVGATVTLTVCKVQENQECKDQMREVNLFGHEIDESGYRDDRMIFGLGPTGVPTKVSVRWPGVRAQTQVIVDKNYLQAHRVLDIYESKIYKGRHDR